MPSMTRPPRRAAPALLALHLLALGVPSGAWGADDAPSAGSPVAPATPPPGKRVPYVPDTVRAQIAEDVKRDVLEQIKQDSWAAPNAAPAWTRRLRPYGDVRVRYEYVSFGQGNAADGSFPDFNAINLGSPFDVNGVDIFDDRWLNVDQNRSRFRLRARLGLDVDLGQGFTLGARIASGDGSTPVSTNQTLGGAPGVFSKYQIWLDQAFLRWQPIDRESGGVMVEAGRFENPFFTVRDLLWSENVNFDGFAAAAEVATGAGWRPFLVAGAFPVFSTALNYPVERQEKYPSLDKWMFGGQVGVGWKGEDGLQLKLGAAFYDFVNVSGKLSPSCDTFLKNITCSTDDTRPLFAQKGNTYMELRTPSPAAVQLEATSTVPRYMYYGLASQFRELIATGRLDVPVSPAVTGTLEAEFAWNAGFDKGAVGAIALNNRGACDGSGTCDQYAGGGIAYVGRVGIGSPTLNHQWDWNVALTYSHVESDAVLDAFVNSDFGLGGTNLKGFWIGGRVSLTDNLSAGLRWMSADNIVGPTFRVDLAQVDVWGRF
jgi:hypothetical protein